MPSISAALEILGGDHRFVTGVHVDGEVVDGVLDGSLTLRGGGDPFLTGDHLQVLAHDLTASGIRKVTGRFLYDAGPWIEVPQINPGQPEAADYNTGVSALSVNFNRVRVRWRNNGTAVSGEAVTVSDNLTLPVGAIGFVEAEEPPPGPFVRAGLPSEDRWLLSPALSKEGEDWLPVGDPALVTAEIFRALAEREGIVLPKPTAGPTPAGAREIARHESIPLSRIAAAVLRYSNNLSAELIGLAASRAATGRSLPLEGSAAVLADWWRQRLPGVDWKGFYLENQSGLSSKSRTTPRQLVAMLKNAVKPIGGAALHDLLLPASWKAKDGTLVKIHAKTGTMSYARGLAGYIDATDGRHLAFAVFFNDLDGRSALDAAFDPHVRAIDPESRKWLRRAHWLEEVLVTSWARGS